MATCADQSENASSFVRTTKGVTDSKTKKLFIELKH